MVRDAIGAKEIACAIGGSMGGMQVLEWLFEDTSAVPCRHGVCMAAGGKHHAWQIGISEMQRQAIYADPNWKGGYYDRHPDSGLSVARMIAMVSYRTHHSFETKFGREIQEQSTKPGELKAAGEAYQVENYLRYQGHKFLERGFDAKCYCVITEQMDSHDVARGRGEYRAVLQSIKQPCLVIAISSDVLYPVMEQEELRDNLPNAEYFCIESNEGHDGFLLEQDAVGSGVTTFLNKHCGYI